MLQQVEQEVKKINPIDSIMRIFKNKASDKTQTLFEHDDKPELKTDVIFPEDILITSLVTLDRKTDEVFSFTIYDDFVDYLLKLRFSLDRKSRTEFVDVNKMDTMSDGLQKLGSIQNLTEVRK